MGVQGAWMGGEETTRGVVGGRWKAGGGRGLFVNVYDYVYDWLLRRYGRLSEAS